MFDWLLLTIGLALVEVLGQVVELEHLVVERIRLGRFERLPRRAIDLGAQQPAVVIQRPTGARGGYPETAGRIIRERFNNSQDRVTAQLASASCFVDKQRASLAVSSLNWLS
jgi:hypothetical protein